VAPQFLQQNNKNYSL